MMSASLSEAGDSSPGLIAKSGNCIDPRACVLPQLIELSNRCSRAAEVVSRG